MKPTNEEIAHSLAFGVIEINPSTKAMLSQRIAEAQKAKIKDALEVKDSEIRALQEKLEKVEAELQDYKDSYSAAKSGLRPDEVHCACAYQLKLALEAAEKERDGYKLAFDLKGVEHDQCHKSADSAWKKVDHLRSLLMGAREALQWANEMFTARDEMNAKVHCSPVRLSPITERVKQALAHIDKELGA